MAQRRIESVLRELASVQDGVATRAQLRERGFSDSCTDRLLRSGRLVPVHPGVHQIGAVPAPRSAERAATLVAGKDARVSHCSAARVHEFEIRQPRTSTVEVSVPRRRRRTLSGVRIHRVSDLRDDEVTTIDGLPVTTPARTLLDIAECVSEREVEQAYATALRKKLVTPDEMRAMVERHPKHRGTPLWRRLLADPGGPTFTRSDAEEKLLEVVRAADLPHPQLNARVLHYEVDCLWRDARLIAEIDGYAWHSSPRSFAEDRRRDAELVAAGYRVMRFTWEDLVERRLATVVRIAQALVR